MLLLLRGRRNGSVARVISEVKVDVIIIIVSILLVVIAIAIILNFRTQIGRSRDRVRLCW